MSTEAREQFEAKAKREGFTVAFSREVARVLDYHDKEAHVWFTLDTSEHGNDWITLEHHHEGASRSPGYDLAFDRCRQFLEACGFRVEVYGSSKQEA